MLVLKGKKKFIFFLILFLFLTNYQFNKQSYLPLFKINKVKFINHVNLEENVKDEVINYLNNKSLLNINYKKLSLSFSKSDWIKNFKIKKKYPDKIVIQIREFVPIALYKKKQKLYLINSNFEITEKVKTKTNNLNLVQISGLYKKEFFKEKFLIIKKFNIYNDFRSIELLNLNRLDIYFKNNTYVKLGDYDIHFQMNILTKVLKKYKNLKSIDLRNKGRVIIK
ncbi:MAG: hypothetical protein CMI73_01760 [Candidatus Pelagibacter sp.]|nr:hypothetical protein [Candidatus Pelagibacter sp.]OUV87831.1 MAG: hypothetical protein CBC96_01390 [Pelagibacteraceae bacterium TMED136]|tara:strand:+ start:15452 stop:16123 length:672 start_codon:yes stop_codon:yes gene_type:complete